jgi:hypothetical protein
LQRQPDGTWRRSYLGPGIGYSTDEKYQDIAVSVFIPDPDRIQREKYALKLKDSWVRHEFERIPDFINTYSTPSKARVIAGCLILAYQEKDPTVATEREENFVRLIAISIDTDSDRK